MNLSVTLYNVFSSLPRFMGGVDLSDALIGYYSILHKTRKWYRTFFYHFIDIAIVNAFILHKQITKTMGQPSMTQKAFREILILELHGCGSTRTDRPSTPATAAPGCIPVYPRGESTVGRRRCALCHQRTPVVCRACDVTLCLLPKRNCFEEWHDRNV